MRLNLSLGALAAVQLIAGLALQVIVLAIAGAGRDTDAFVAAQTVPLLVFGIFAAPLQSMWLPRLAVLTTDATAWKQQQGIAQGQVLVLVGGAALALICTSGIWLGILFPGLDVQQRRLAARITDVLLVGALFNAYAALLTAALRARDRFLSPEIVVAVGACTAVMAALIVVPRLGVLGAAWVSATRSILVAIVLFALAGRPAISPVRAVRSAEPWRQLRPLLAGSSIYKCSPLVDRFWGSQASAGGLTILSLALTGIGALAQVLERSICTPIVPKLARLAELRNFDEIRMLYRRSIWRVTLLACAVLVMLLVFYPIWNVAMLHMFKMPEHMARQMWLVCVLLLGFLHVSASGSVPVAAFYALGDTKTPVRLSILAFIIGIALKSIGFLLFGLAGLAAATSIYYVGNLVVVSYFLEKRLNADAARGG